MAKSTDVKKLESLINELRSEIADLRFRLDIMETVTLYPEPFGDYFDPELPSDVEPSWGLLADGVVRLHPFEDPQH